jgi:hypothetical protein
MYSTKLTIFGYIVYVVTTKQHDTAMDFVFGDNGRYNDAVTYYTKGRVSIKIIETNEQLPDRTPGWLNYKNQPITASTGGTGQLTFPEDCEWVCIPAKNNSDTLPDVEKVVLTSGQTQTFEVGTKLYVPVGDISIDGQTYPALIRS